MLSYWVFRSLCISYAPLLVMIFLIISSHPHSFTHIVYNLLGRISGSNMLALIFLTLFSISKKTTLRPGASAAPCVPDIPGGYNVNSCSGCYRPGCCPLGAHIKRQGASGAVRCTLSSNHAPSETRLFPAAPDTTGLPTTSLRGLSTMNYLHPVTPSAIP